MAEPGTPERSGIGVVPIEQARTMSGLDLLRGIAAGELPLPPICATLSFDLVEVERGRAVFTGMPDARLYNPLGTVHGGYASTLLDSCMGCAIHSMLEAGQSYTTLELKVNLVRALDGRTGPVRAEGTVISLGRRVGTAEGRLIDAAGKLYAHATTTCLIFPI